MRFTMVVNGNFSAFKGKQRQNPKDLNELLFKFLPIPMSTSDPPSLVFKPSVSSFIAAPSKGDHNEHTQYMT